MKKRAIILPLFIMFLYGASARNSLAQDTIVGGTYPDWELSDEEREELDKQMELLDEQMELLDEQLKAMDEELMKHLETIDFHHDSLMMQLELMEIDMHDFSVDLHDFVDKVFTTNVKVTGDSKTKEVNIDVEEEIQMLNVMIDGIVTSGNMDVGVYDPSGKKKGSFSIECDTDSSGEEVHGLLNRNYNAPMAGTWKVKINSEKAHGNVMITSLQH